MSSLSRRTQRGSVALSPAEYRANAVGDLFRLYANHQPFREGLVTLADEQRPSAPHLLPLRGHGFPTVEDRANRSDGLKTYVDAVRSFAAEWGLDRIDGSTGIDAVYRWVDLAFQDREEAGGSFGFRLSLASDYPGVDLTVHVGDGFEWNPEEEPRVDSEVKIPDTVVRGLYDNRGLPAQLRAIYGWRMRDPRSGARSRILKALKPEQATAVDAELDRIQGDVESLGWRYSDTEHQYTRDLRWTFERLALKRAVWQIVNDSGVSQPRVYAALERMRQRLGIDVYPPVPRKPEVNPRH